MQVAILIKELELIMKQWEKNYYITSIAGVTNGSSLVVLSKEGLRTVEGFNFINFRD
ncbi:unnamed protein product [Trifolium pratense]|uniref:Uncharacterized protein n=1 Tax=Trifolium pratense TaxID=57577 RepID=A0ACB0MFL9_TRIPR|nr:unnamed protein product [Trifolium pratense]